MYNKQQYKNVRHQATRRAQIWLKKMRHLDTIQVLFITVYTPLLSCCRSEKNPQHCHYVREVLRPSGKHAFHI